MKKALKFLSLGLVMCMCLTMLPTAVFAATAPCDNAMTGTCVAGNGFAPTTEGGLCEACLAAQSADHSATTPGDYAANVALTTASSYTVKIPKSIDLDSTSKKGTYSVVVNGDIAGNEQITVTPAASFVMKQDGKADITAYVTADATVVDAAGAAKAEGTTLTGTIDATAASAGEWNGTLNFNVSFGTTD